MNLKHGRTRKVNAPGDVVSFLLEVGERVEDQVSHLPPEAINRCAPNSVLSVGRLVLHLVQTDLKLLPAAVPLRAPAPYADAVEPGLLADETALPGDLGRAPQVLRDHLVFRARWLEGVGRGDWADEALDHPRFHTRGALVRHLIWHWSYHSGQIGLMTLEAGWDYRWV